MTPELAVGLVLSAVFAFGFYLGWGARGQKAEKERLLSSIQILEGQLREERERNQK